MAHLKVWLCVLLTLALSALLWKVPQTLNARIEQHQQQLSPLKANGVFQKKIRAFTKKLSGTLRQLSSHGATKAALADLAAKLPDRRGRKHKEAHKKIKQAFTFFRGSQQNKRIYIFAKSQRLLFRSDQPDALTTRPHPLQYTPFVSQAFKGKIRLGFWHYNSRALFLAATPVGSLKAPTGVMLMSIRVNREFFVEMGIDPEGKGQPAVILLDRGEPLAYAIPGPLSRAVKNWAAPKYHTLAKDFELGTHIPNETVVIAKQKFGLYLGRFPTAISDSPIGYLLLARLPKAPKPKDLYRGQLTQWIGMGAAGFAFLMGLWFSLASIVGRRRLHYVVNSVAQAPQQVAILSDLPRTYKKLREPLKILMGKATEVREVKVPVELPKPAPAAVAKAPAPEPALPPLDPNAPPPSPFAPDKPPLGSQGPKLPPGLMDPSFAASGGPEAPQTPAPPAQLPTLEPSQLPLQESVAPASAEPATPGYNASAPPTAGTAPLGNPPSEDLADELEMAFSNIQDDELPQTEAPSNGNGNNRQTLLYQQFDERDLAAATAEVKEEQLHKVFESYIELRRRCGEATDNIQFEQFVRKLDKQRDTILKQFECTDVQFHVYEKGGRAAIKATPIK